MRDATWGFRNGISTALISCDLIVSAIDENELIRCRIHRL